MKKNSVSLDFDDFEDIEIGVLKIDKPYTDHEFFYLLNKLNNCHFYKEEDLIIKRKFYTYFHSVFKGYQEDTHTSLTFISNQSYHTIKEKEITELFTEPIVNHLLKNEEFNGFLIKTKPLSTDFSLLLLPDNVEPIKVHDIDATQDIYYEIESYE